jgi:hypothetical protein
VKGTPGNHFRSRWLKRARRELAASGAASQLAVLLAGEDGVPAAQWERRLRQLLDGNLPPDPEILFRIETHLARPQDKVPPAEFSASLQTHLDL